VIDGSGGGIEERSGLMHGGGAAILRIQGNTGCLIGDGFNGGCCDL
jgi:hypothetical protein